MKTQKWFETEKWTDNEGEEQETKYGTVHKYRDHEVIFAGLDMYSNGPWRVQVYHEPTKSPIVLESCPAFRTPQDAEYYIDAELLHEKAV